MTSLAAAPDRSRQARGMERWRARSQLIRRLRIVLPAAMGAILLLMFGWITIGGLIMRLGERGAGGVALIHMTNAHFFGRDSAGRAYVLGAAEASRDDKDLKLVALVGPNLSLDDGKGGLTRLVADHGAYREDNRMVRLGGHVTLTTPSGDVFHTELAIVDTVRGNVIGPGPVVGRGPTGMISARSFGIYNQGSVAVFRGEVHSVMKRH